MTGVPAARGSAEGFVSDWCCDPDTISCHRDALDTKRKHEALLEPYSGTSRRKRKCKVMHSTAVTHNESLAGDSPQPGKYESLELAQSGRASRVE